MKTKNRSLHELKTRFAHFTASEMLLFYEKYVYINGHNSTANNLWSLFEIKEQELTEANYIQSVEIERESDQTRMYNQD